MPGTKPTSVRLSEKDLALIDRAARIQGLKKSEFIVHSVRAAATNSILDAQVLVASNEQFAAIEAYLNRSEPNSLLEQALEKGRKNPLW